MTPRDIDSPEFAAKIAERTEELVRNGQAVFETAHLTKDGRVIPIEASARILTMAESPLCSPPPGTSPSKREPKKR